jgi:hypothetical protein
LVNTQLFDGSQDIGGRKSHKNRRSIDTLRHQGIREEAEEN